MDRSRRALIGGALLAAFAPGRAVAASPPVASAPQPDIDPPSPEEALDPLALRIIANQVTRMSTRVEVAGHGPFAFVIDTGAERSTLSTELADSLRLERGPNVLVHGVTGPEVTPSARTPSLRISGLSFRDLILPIAPRSRLGADGLLGLDALAGFRLTFDTEAGQILLVRPREFRGIVTGGPNMVTGSRIVRQNALEARQRGGQLTIVGVEADDVRVEAFIDSGAQYSVGNPALFEAVALRRPGLRQRRWSVPLVGVNGQTLMGELATIDTLAIGTARLHDLAVVFADLHAFRVMDLAETPALLLGADLIGAFDRVTLDFANKEVRFAGQRRRPESLIPRG